MNAKRERDVRKISLFEPSCFPGPTKAFSCEAQVVHRARIKQRFSRGAAGSPEFNGLAPGRDAEFVLEIFRRDDAKLILCEDRNFRPFLRFVDMFHINVIEFTCEKTRFFRPFHSDFPTFPANLRDAVPGHGREGEFRCFPHKNYLSSVRSPSSFARSRRMNF